MKIAVLLSGGVDSSVALKMLKEQGHELYGFYLKIWLEDELSFLGDCPWQEDLDYVQRTCQMFDVPLKVIPLQSEYHKVVVKYVLDELKVGRTPSPDILCNHRVKFGFFPEKIDASFDKVASGHYASVVKKGDLYYLKRGVDPVKDQTYFLSHLNQSQLSRCLFPIGEYSKAQIRDIAIKAHLPSAQRPDSQGICFLGKIKYNDFVSSYLGKKEGQIIDIDTGKKLGVHQGFWFHTVGQRKGLGLAGGPWFVVKKDVKKNIVYVSHESQYLKYVNSTFIIDECNWILGSAPTQQDVLVRVRHSPKIVPAKLQILDGGQARVSLSEPDPGIATGQFAVVYDGDFCLGCGVISSFDQAD